MALAEDYTGYLGPNQAQTYSSGDASSNADPAMSPGDVYLAAINNGATHEQAQWIAQAYLSSPGIHYGGDAEGQDTSSAARFNDAISLGITKFPDSEFARLTRSRSPTFQDSFEDLAGFAAKSAALYAGASYLGGAGAAEGAAGGAAGAGTTDAGYLAAADTAGGMAPAYGTSAGYSAGMGGAAGATGGAGTVAATTAGSTTASTAAPAATGSLWSSPALVNTLGSLGSAYMQNSAAKDASAAQQAAAQAGITEQGRQFDAVQSLLKPYVGAGTGGLAGQQALLGMSGPQAQQQAIDAIKGGPQFQTLLKQGENSILSNASATGGLRGGNTQAALAQFSPQLLNQLIDQQYSRLGGMTSLGQNSAVMQGNAGMQTGNQITNLLQQQGAAQAGGALADGRFGSQVFNGLAQGYGQYMGMQQPSAAPNQYQPGGIQGGKF